MIVSQTHHTGVLVEVLAPPLLIQLLTNVPGKTVVDGPSTWVSPTHVGDEDGISSFSLVQT